MAKGEASDSVRKFQHALMRHLHWLEDDYLRRTGHTDSELALAASLARYIRSSLLYSLTRTDVRASEITRRRTKIEQSCLELGLKWFEKDRH